MRWLGAILVAGACGCTGFVRTATLSRQIALLEELCMLLRRARNELCQRNTPLPELFEGLGDLRFFGIAEQLRRGMPLPEAAQPFLVELEHKRGLVQSAHSLKKLAQVLGRYDSITQAEACDWTLTELEEQKQRLQQELREKGTLYRTAPLAFGAMAALAVL